MPLGPRADLVTVPDGPGAKAPEPEESPDDPLLPARIGRFAIESRLGAGGMGVVYKAEDKQLGRKIAIKLLRSSPGDEDESDGAAKLLREAQTLAKLDHPIVVAVYVVGVLDGEVFVAMEFIEGKTLRQWLRGGPRPWREVLDAFVQAGRGLAAAHKAGLVHRDFKPENAMIDGEGRVRVLDFGLARAAGAGPPSSLVARMIRSGTSGPQTSSIAGTPAYMAPEQHLGLPCDARSDQFSFCVALYEGLYGVRPFPDGDSAQRYQAIMAGELRRPGKLAPRSGSSSALRPVGKPPKIPRWLRAAVQVGLSPVPNTRFESMDALLAALTEAPRRRRRRWVAGVIVVLMAVVAGLGWSLYVEKRDVCGEGADRVSALWAARRDAVQAAILGAGTPYAADVWTALDASMAARGGAWARLFEASCEERRRGVIGAELLDLQTACLNEQALDTEAVLRSLVDLPELARDPGAAARQAGKVFGQLDPIALCGDPFGLKARGWSVPELERAGQLDELRVRITEARSTGEMGLYRQGLTLAEEALAEARELGEPGLLAEALLRVGNLHKALTQHAEAATFLEDAHWTALASGADETAAEAASSLLVVAGYYLDDRERGRVWERQAEALLRRAPGNPRVEGSFYNNRAVVRANRGDYDGAAEDYRKAYQIYSASEEPAGVRIAVVLGNMSRVEFSRGNLAEAALRLEQSLAIRQREWGDGHPEVAITMSNLALVLTETGDLARAVELLRRALVIEETLHGPRHPKLVPTLDNLARALARAGRFDEALQLAYRALHILEAEGSRDAMMVDVLSGLGTTAALQGRFEEALPRLREALAQAQERRGAGHPDTARAQAELVEGLLLAGQPAEAPELARAALATSERSFGATAAQTYAARGLLGRALLATGDASGATILEEVQPALARGAPLARGRARAALARARAASDPELARDLAAAAAADLRAAGEGFARERAALVPAP